MMSRAEDPLHDHRVLIESCLTHGVPFFWRGRGTLLIAGSGAGTVIEAVEASGQTVVGLEGFELESTEIHPRLDLIYDAMVAPRGGPAAVASGWGNDVWIDMTLGP